MNSVITELKAEADRLEWDSLYSMKGHFNASTIWNLAHYSLGIGAVVLGVLAGKQGTASAPATWEPAIVVSAALTAIITFLKPSDKARPHHEAGVCYAEIKRKARMFQNITIAMEADQHALKRELDQLIAAYHKRQESAPPIPSIAYRLARLGVRNGEHTYNEPGESK